MVSGAVTGLRFFAADEEQPESGDEDAAGSRQEEHEAEHELDAYVSPLSPPPGRKARSEDPWSGGSDPWSSGEAANGFLAKYGNKASPMSAEEFVSRYGTPTKESSSSSAAPPVIATQPAPEVRMVQAAGECDEADSVPRVPTS